VNINCALIKLIKDRPDDSYIVYIKNIMMFQNQLIQSNNFKVTKRPIIPNISIVKSNLVTKLVA